MAEERRSPRGTEPAGAGASVGQASGSTHERRDQTQEIGKEARQNVQEQRNQMQETGKEVRHHVQELATQGKEVAAEYYEEGRERVLAWQQQLEHQVREKPLQSLLIAAGLGLLFGLLKRR